MSLFDPWFAVNLIDVLLDGDDLTLPGRDTPTLDDLVVPAPDADDTDLFEAGPDVMKNRSLANEISCSLATRIGYEN